MSYNLEYFITHKIKQLAIVIWLMALLLVPCCDEDSNVSTSQWVAGDFHNHSFLSDGRCNEEDIVKHAFTDFKLDCFANSEHGGFFWFDPQGTLWQDLVPQPIFLGDPPAPPIFPAKTMWRWQSLRDYSWPLLQRLKAAYPEKIIIQGYEWNVPGHNHASVGIVGVADGVPIARHEYLFDETDTGTTSDAYLGVTRQDYPTPQAQTLAGIAWLKTNYPGNSYMFINHPSKITGKNSIQDLRDFNDTAPNICFGIEALPGHQKAPYRGEYVEATPTPPNRTYGGMDYMLAKIGGSWDALLGEGRRFWIFANSDFHAPQDDDGVGIDFYPGEYAKTYLKISENTAQGVVDGMRSGCSFIVEGDLIAWLDFSVLSGSVSAQIGQTLPVKSGAGVIVNIRFASPDKNNNGNKPEVDHIDLIVGDVTGIVADTNPSTRILKRFSAADWGGQKGGGQVSYPIANVQQNMYLRLRGTNVAVGTAGETDAEGNPLMDEAGQPTNTTAKAWADLWFYSNPIFVKIE